VIATITLNPSIDQHILVESLMKDDANRAREVFCYPGGKGVNVSKGVRELGGQTRAYAILGGFPGEYWKELIEKLDIPYFSHAVKGDTRINTVITDLKDATQTRISAPGPAVPQKDLEDFLRKLLKVRPKPFLWVFGGSLSRGMKHSTYAKFIRVLQEQGAPCVLDTDDEALRFGVRAKPFMIKPNEFEIQRLMNRSFKTIEEYAAAAKILVRQGVKIVVVSLAERGALFVTKSEAFHATTPKVKVKSHVGAGDSLIAGLALGLYKGRSLKEAAKLGVAASTSAVMREAPRLCLRKDIPGLLERVKVYSYGKF